MTLNGIIGIADTAYPDGLVGQYFRDPGGEHGDPLAGFVAAELKDTYDGEATDAEQLDTALSAMKTAICELQDVADALEKEAECQSTK